MYTIAYSLQHGPWRMTQPLPDVGAVCEAIGVLARLGLTGWEISGGGV